MNQLDTRYEVVNLAVGGQTTYNLLPTGTAIPPAVNQTINTAGNVTAALNAGADGIVINLPSNDAARGYPVTNQLQNYQCIIANATAANVPVWITTPQPRDFGGNTTALTIQQNMLAATWNTYTSITVDFWTGFPVAGDNGLLAIYDSGDGVHANNTAHQIFFERMLAFDIHGMVKQRVDSALDSSACPPGSSYRACRGTKAELSIYPNPASSILHIHGLQEMSSYQIIDMSGRTLLQGTTDEQIEIVELIAGTYLLLISGQQHKIIKK